MAPALRRVPNAVVELLRLCVVVFFAGLGYYVAEARRRRRRAGPRARSASSGSGVILGSALGYVLGGVLGRGTSARSAHTEAGLRDTPAEQIVAGVVGAVHRRPGGRRRHLAGLPDQPAPPHLPGLRLRRRDLGLLGFRLGTSKRDAVLGMFGAGSAWPGAAGPGCGAAAGARHLGRDRRPHPRRRPSRLPARRRCSCRPRCSASCRGWRTPVTTSAAREGPARARGARDAAARAGRRRRGARRRGARGARGRRQAGADLPGPRRRAAHPGHQPGQGRGAGRRPGDEPARPRARAAPARSAPATRSACCSSSPARSRARPWATSTTARWSSSSAPATRSARRSRCG